jgi:hypothetical protein
MNFKVKSPGRLKALEGIDTDGAVDIKTCPLNTTRFGCRCPRCAKCGYRMHEAIHRPARGERARGRPWHHKFVPVENRGGRYA